MSAKGSKVPPPEEPAAASPKPAIDKGQREALERMRKEELASLKKEGEGGGGGAWAESVVCHVIVM